MYIRLLSTGACANINIREIMLISIISSASWTLHLPPPPLVDLFIHTLWAYFVCLNFQHTKISKTVEHGMWVKVVNSV